MSYIIDKHEDTELYFTLQNVEISFANAIRRSILSMIPVVGLKTEPYEVNEMIIHKNTTRLNNEIMKHRLSCVPIHLYPDDDISRYLVTMHVKNDSDNIVDITTEDLLIKDIKTDKYVTEEERNRIFPANPITKEYILLTKLYPRVHLTSEMEELHLECPMKICYAHESGVYNATSTCSYGFTPNPVKQKQEWDKVKHIENDKINWYLHDGKRYFKDKSYDFRIESVGVYSNTEIVQISIQMIVKKLKLYLEKVQNRRLVINDGDTVEASFDIQIPNDNYTIGKLIENTLYVLHYQQSGVLSYVAYKKLHPHIDYSVIRLIFKEEHVDESNIYKLLFESIQYIIQMYEKILKEI